MERILLIHPEETRNRFKFTGIVEDEPLEIEIIHTVCKEAGYKTYIFDPDRTLENIHEVIAKFKPTVMYVNGVIKQLDYIKEYVNICYENNIKTIVGGIYAEYNYKNLYSDNLDYICRSYDPYVVVEIIKYIEGKRKKISDLNGLCYKKNNVWKENEITYFDINKLPRVDRTHFYKHKDSFCFMGLSPVSHVRSAYSCPSRCSFCYRSKMNCGMYITKDVTKFVEEINEIDCENIYIVDDNFLINRDYLNKFIKLIKEKKINKKFICFGRCDFIVNNKDIIKELKNIGFQIIMIGLEAATDNYLINYNKKINIDNNADCAMFLKEIGITMMAMMIVDLKFKHKDFIALYNWVKKYEVKYVIISILTPLPGSNMFDICKDKLITNDPKKWDYTHLVVKPDNISVKMFYFYYLYY
jgi:radical SAM superfamily enzyme YgiQ (UPF0313 family)